MNQIDLLNETQKLWVGDASLSPSQEIKYVYKDSTFEITRANVAYAKENKQERSYLTNSLVFADVVLSRSPDKGDTIFHQGKAWQVVSSKGRNGIYMIHTQSGKQQTMGKTNQPYKM